MKTKYNKVTTKKALTGLFEESALTFTAVPADQETMDLVTQVLREHGALLIDEVTGEEKAPVFHAITGKYMNEAYKLEGNVRYGDDITLVCVTGINQMAFAIPRFNYGGRWFDDIVTNNAEHMKGY